MCDTKPSGSIWSLYDVVFAAVVAELETMQGRLREPERSLRLAFLRATVDALFRWMENPHDPSAVKALAGEIAKPDAFRGWRVAADALEAEARKRGVALRPLDDASVRHLMRQADVLRGYALPSAAEGARAGTVAASLLDAHDPAILRPPQNGENEAEVFARRSREAAARTAALQEAAFADAQRKANEMARARRRSPAPRSS